MARCCLRVVVNAGLHATDACSDVRGLGRLRPVVFSSFVACLNKSLCTTKRYNASVVFVRLNVFASVRFLNFLLNVTHRLCSVSNALRHASLFCSLLFALVEVEPCVAATCAGGRVAVVFIVCVCWVACDVEKHELILGLVVCWCLNAGGVILFWLMWGGCWFVWGSWGFLWFFCFCLPSVDTDMLSLLLVPSDWVVISGGDGDCMIDKFEISVCGGGLNGCPEHLDVHSISIDKGVEDVEVLS